MGNLILTGVFIFIVAASMTMVGKGGGNFYVVILTISGIPMHEAAATGQFILFSASVAAMMIFQKNKSISWTLALLTGTLTAVAALCGGYFSHLFSGFMLKLIFAFMLFAAGILMLVPVSAQRNSMGKNKYGTINIRSGQDIFRVNLFIALPITVLTGFGAGMVGVSGGSFLVPLMVLACGVSMHTAVGTASALIATTALMGCIGHAVQGDFNPSWAVPMAVVTIMGGILGSKFSIKSKPDYLKKLFAYTNWIAAFFMLFNALQS